MQNTLNERSLSCQREQRESVVRRGARDVFRRGIAPVLLTARIRASQDVSRRANDRCDLDREAAATRTERRPMAATKKTAKKAPAKKAATKKPAAKKTVKKAAAKKPAAKKAPAKKKPAAKKPAAKKA